ncbi:MULTISPECIES: helix-turn-helix domain-containing protein [unclassified Streptomyces]|uniref:helix-turn-helix domain-containing protein n=1 Tax=unclassified Streptomyces TaxID=2593676 RepID=UPI00278C4297|nr:MULTISPECIES: AraC family transcriptional regulator [unclassified Streptomyces]
MEHLIEYAVNTIRERYNEPLSLDELAQSAMVSKFHFLRTFRRVTGVTPGRFLSAVRLQEAKRLLLSTPLNVSNISVQVGYSSTGSFTRRFTESVGCSPTQYRQRARGRLPDVGWGEAPPAGAGAGTVSGTVVVPGPDVSAVYLGVFESPILERCPAVRMVIAEPGPFQLTGVPAGTWFIHAVSHGTFPDDVPCASRQDLFVDTVGPIVTGGNTVLRQDLVLQPPRWYHPPVLLALPDLLGEPAAAA